MCDVSPVPTVCSLLPHTHKKNGKKREQADKKNVANDTGNWSYSSRGPGAGCRVNRTVTSISRPTNYIRFTIGVDLMQGSSLGLLRRLSRRLRVRPSGTLTVRPWPALQGRGCPLCPVTHMHGRTIELVCFSPPVRADPHGSTLVRVWQHYRAEVPAAERHDNWRQTNDWWGHREEVKGRLLKVNGQNSLHAYLWRGSISPYSPCRPTPRKGATS